MAEPGCEEQESTGGSSWFADILGDGSAVQEQLEAIKLFAYKAFDKLDRDGNGFISDDELETALQSGDLLPRERNFLTFLQENHDQIADAFNENTISDGISRQDLEAYFDLVATLL